MKTFTAFFTMFVAVFLISGAALAESKSVDDRYKFDGLWVGTGKVNDEYGENYTCTGGGEIPIAFIVIDGVAKCMFRQKGLDFQVKVKDNGKIMFTYKNIATENDGSGGLYSIPIVFRGKLKATKGKGSLYFANCGGRWEVTKKE